MSTPSPSPSSSAGKTLQAPSSLKVVGIILAIVSGVLIGCSFVFKKRGLLRSQAGQTAGQGVAYLKSPLWWTGMIMMILGELCNFAAYAFTEALVVTPLGALSVVISAIMSSIFLDEKLTFFGWLGCALCIIGSTIIALNGPQEATVGQITVFQHMFLSPIFIVYASLLIGGALSVIFYFGPKYGNKNMIWYILVCSLIGGLSVSVTTGLGSAIVTTVMGDNQFKHWFIYFLLVFIAVTLVTEVFYLNKALALFNTAMVTPTYYVIFSFCSMVTTVVLFKGLKASASQIITIVMAFLVICVGITILQMSKVDPTEFKKLDRRSTILLEAARNQTEAVDEKSVAGMEDPGIDTLRGSFGTVGSIIRARSARRMSQSSSPRWQRRQAAFGTAAGANLNHYGGMQRHQLFDPPVPHGDSGSADGDAISLSSQLSARKPTIKFGEQDVVHSYHRGTAGRDDLATHERRTAPHTNSPLASPQPAPHSGLTPPDNLTDDPLRESPRTLTPDGGVSLGLPAQGDPEVLGLRTAPPRLGLGVPSSPDSYRDPFAGSPASATEATFGDDDAASRRGSHHRRFSRQTSSRDYPRGPRGDDAEESLSLWNPHGDSEGEGSVESESEHGASPESMRGTVRLVGAARPGRF
ncbi:magnesium transporter NIPA-domain-containing protein [Gloeopeniophorella convolvens]|nr:magnesium transporter NIPA-domain-containing protein [Gloeopeniophorella convolvens]